MTEILFLSTLPARGATIPGRLPGLNELFLSTLPARGATPRPGPPYKSRSYFYPRSPRGERRLQDLGLVWGIIISIHAPREGSDGGRGVGRRRLAAISIHAPREGSDHQADGKVDVLRHISIHAPREGSDSPSPDAGRANAVFLSTLPARGATGAVGLTRRLSFDFYPRSPRGERRPCRCACCRSRLRFLSTLPARGATAVVYADNCKPQFLSTLPARGAT